MRNKYGILELDLGEITTQISFDTELSEDITSRLSEQQKDVIRQAYYGTSKLIYVKCKVIDENNDMFEFKGFGCIVDANFLQVYGYSYSVSTWIRVTFIYDKANDIYKIYL